MGTRASRAGALLALAAWAAGWTGCQAPPPPAAAPAITDPHRVQVIDGGEFGPYRTVTLVGGGGRHELFLPPSAPCRAIAAGGEARFEPEGPLGTLWAPPARCEPVGVGSLARWRDGLGQRRSPYLQPRETARFRLAHEDRGRALLLLRGSFPVALELRWPAPTDAVVVVPDSPACRRIAERGEADLTFHAMGAEPLVLGEGAERCAILGLAHPLTLD